MYEFWARQSIHHSWHGSNLDHDKFLCITWVKSKYGYEKERTMRWGKTCVRKKQVLPQPCDHEEYSNGRLEQVGMAQRRRSVVMEMA